LDIQSILSGLSVERPVFHNEADFQHALAWAIRERHPDAKIRLEMKVHGANTKVYLDILVQLDGRKYAIELKYKPRNVECVVEGEEFALINQGAQDIGRYDVLKDVQRLERMVAEGIVDSGFLVFLTNDLSYSTDSRITDDTVDRDFRLHEGRTLHGTLGWGERAGAGTTKGREEPIVLAGSYRLKWAPYSVIPTVRGGEFRYLLLHVNGQPEQGQVRADREPAVLVRQEETTMREVTIENGSKNNWFPSFVAYRLLPVSQADVRDQLSSHLRKLGYAVQINRELGKDKVDIWARKQGADDLAIEVRCKTALLQTMYEGRHVHLKNHGAHDLARYDFLKDIEKLESVATAWPGVKGYALLITNDHLYWKSPTKLHSVDEAFHIHEGRRVAAGTYAWREEASSGTTVGREQPLRFGSEYAMRWQPYLQLGTKKNEEFRVLLVEVPGTRSV